MADNKITDPIKQFDTSKILIANNAPTGRNDIRYYDRISKFGVLDPYNKLTYGKEYLFFTKPDCHIFEPNTTNLQEVFKNDQFFIDLKERQPDVIGQLQRSAGSDNTSGPLSSEVQSPFMNLLTNSVTNTLDLSALSAGTMDGPANMWGSGMSYRKDAWGGDEQVEFSLEFEDTKYLDIYYLLKAYEIYNRYKMAGYIYPPNLSGAKVTANGDYYDSYTAKKQLHDTFGIYKFIVDDDYTRLLYWAYVCGAYFVNVPRDAFNSMNGVVEGLKFTVDFKAFCVDDMNPIILADFNNLVLSKYSSKIESGITERVTGGGSTEYTSESETYDRINGEWATFPLITKATENADRTKLGIPSTMKHVYEIHWFK